MKPLVSIICIAYNQEKFLRQTLDGFMMQKTSFDFEILIHDDCSNDNTPEIIREYSKKYPQIFKPTFESTNKFSKGDYSFFSKMFTEANGDYIALCEGDDYWTDPNKLQVQVDFMNNNLDYSICFHPVSVVFEDKKNEPYIFPEQSDKKYFTLKKLLEKNFIQTNSVMYRKINYKNFKLDGLPLDWYIHLFHAQFGKIGFINKVMSVYRRHPGGVWWEGHNDITKFWVNNWENYLVFYQNVLIMFSGVERYRKIITNSITDTFITLNEIDMQSNLHLVDKASSTFPDFSSIIIKSLCDKNSNMHTLLKSKEEIIDRDVIIIEKLKSDYLGIINSSSWKITKPLRKVKSKLGNKK